MEYEAELAFYGLTLSPCRKPDIVPMTKADLKEAILELCSDDYYGVWEFYWNYQGLQRAKDVDDELLIEALKELAMAKNIMPYDKNEHMNEFEPATLDLDRLRSELKEIRAGNVMEDFYWFGRS